MDFALDPAAEAFKDTVRRFTRERLASHYQESDRTETHRPGTVAELAGLGLLGLLIPEAHGGQGATHLVSGIACEELAYGDFCAGWLVLNASLTSDVITANSTPAQQARWLPGIAAGDTVPAICLTEPDHGSDAASLEMAAIPDGDSRWRLTGEKASVSYGMHAQTGLVFARTGACGARGVTAFYVDLDADHVTREPYRDLGGRAVGRATLRFDGLPVQREDIVGQVEGTGFTQVMQGFDYSRALIALICLGAAQAAVDDALGYARERVAFGQTIGRFQGVSFPLVEQATYLRAARLLCYEALWRKDQGLPHTVEANMAKWWVPRMCADAAHQALLTFGQVGYSEDVPQGQRLRDIIGMEIGDGTAQIAKLVVARQLLGREHAP